MDQVDRDTIQANIKQLSSFVELDNLYGELIERGVIDHNFIERIKAKHTVPQDQAQEFFLNYTKRGPHAFRILVEALESTGHISEANALKARQARALGQSPRHNGIHNGHIGPSTSSPPSSNPPSSTSSLQSSPLMRSRVEPISGQSTPSSSTSSLSVAGVTGQMRKLSMSISFEDQAPLVIQVTKATLYNMGETDPEKAYQMLSKPRGYALIINNIEFMGDAEAKREGAENDSLHLQQLLEQLGFIVMIRHNVRKIDLIDTENGILRKFMDQFQGSGVDACVVAIMSHGKEGYYLRTYDHEDTRNPHWNYWNFYEEVLKRFNNRWCPALKGKPKIFIVQACLGKVKDRGVRRTQVDAKTERKESIESLEVTANEWSSEPPEDIPETEDMLVCISTVPGYVSNRDVEHGTWYIWVLCKVFMENAHQMEVIQLLKQLGRDIRKLTCENQQTKQMSSYHDIGFHKNLYFNPGLFENSGVVPVSSPVEANGVEEDSSSISA